MVVAEKPANLPHELVSIVQVRQKTVRVYFLQLAVFGCFVVVTGQTMNTDDALALNQSLTGLGCWRSATCKAQNFSCSTTGPVLCNAATGSVTFL